MKTTIAILIFFVFSFLNFTAEYISDGNVNLNFHPAQSADKQDPKSIDQTETVSTYKINVNFDELQRKIFISGSLNWVNKNNTTIKGVYVNIPSGVGGNGKLKYHLKLTKLFEQFDYEFIPAESELFIDSSLVKLKLQNELKFGDTLKINFSFSASENSSIKWGKNIFLQFENWYPQIAVFSSGNFIAYSKHKYIKTFSEFSNYNVSFTIPDHFDIAAPGIDETIKKNGKRTYHCSIKNTPSFDWILFNNYIESSFNLKTTRQKIVLKIFTQKGNDSYIQRYRQAAEKYLNDLSMKFNFPYRSLTIIELPQNEDLLEKSYPAILAVKPKILSPVGSQKLEYGVASLLAEQFLGNIAAPDNFKYAWISKGVSAYIAEKLVRKEYGKLYSYFRLARYYPIRGLHFLSFSEIPLIYTLGDEVIPEGGRFINKYYKDIIYCDSSIPSSYFPNYELYRAASVVKPQLALLTLERYLGSEKLFNNLAGYYNKFKYKHPTSDEFLESIAAGCSGNTDQFINDLLQTGKRFDYAIKYLKKISENKYEILAERREGGISPVDINVYTDEDTIKLNWDGKDSFKRFVFYTRNEVIAAALDPQEKNILDLNFSNNSFVMKNKYWGSLSLSTRIFFWIQNALLLIGSIG